jgi:hypothetical protein
MPLLRVIRLSQGIPDKLVSIAIVSGQLSQQQVLAARIEQT